MFANTVVLKNIDPKSLHQQISQLESMQRDMMSDDSMEADMIGKTVKMLHMIEEELRKNARSLHQH